MNWIKKNWLRLAFVILGTILLLFVISTVRSCDDAVYREDIKELNKEIKELKDANLKLGEEVNEYFKDAQGNEKVVASLKVEVAEGKARIEDLEREEAKIEIAVAELPPSRLVEETREILGCQDILLNEEGILFSVECAREGLLKLKRFSLVEKKYDEAILALSKAEEAVHFQERVSWNLYGVAWKLGDQILNLKVIAKKTGKKFERSEKQRRKSWWNGLKIGLVIGGGLTVTFVIVVPMIKALI